MKPHETGFLLLLAEPDRRRVGALLELGERKRADVRALLDHKVRLDPRHARRLAGAESFPARAEALLRAAGAPDAGHILASSAELDGREMPLRQALEAIMGSGHGAFLSCIPGRLGFYEYEDESSWLLARQPG